MAHVGVLVADSGAFIKAASLEKWSKNVVTIKEVVSEIKDSDTRRRLQVLPYDLSFKEPSQIALRHVTDFAKKTGDYQSLSAVDLQLVALTYQLELERGREKGANLRSEPLRNQPAAEQTRVPGLVGVYNGSKKTAEVVSNYDASSSGEIAEKTDTDVIEQDEAKSKEEVMLESPEEEEEECGSDDSEGWITPENFQEACEEMGGALTEEPNDIAVGCITTDFAMQNVMLQMGLNVISVDGMLVKQLRTYALKCKACFKTTNSTTEMFCPHCGNKSLVKVCVKLDKGGTFHYHYLTEKQFSHKGLRYSLPLPKGGRHADDLLLAPDQRITYRQPRRRMDKVDPLDPDYIAKKSPFAMTDVTSRGAQISFAKGGSSGRRQRNPNQVRPKGRKK